MTISNHQQLCELLTKSVNENYNFDPGTAEILKISENITLVYKTVNCKKYIIRLNKKGYHTKAELEGEMAWLTVLEKEDIKTPFVYPNKQGEKITSLCNCTLGDYYSVFSFEEGVVLNQTPLKELPEKMEQVGAIAAKLHKSVIGNKSLLTLSRPYWDYDDLIGTSPRLGDFRENSMLTAKDLKTLNLTAEKIKSRLSSYGKSETTYGLIHGDFHLSNIMDNMCVIDFDDCGYGYFLYDLGSSLLQYSQNLSALANSWLLGYQKVHPLTKADLNEVWTFIILRRIVRIGWVKTHGDSDTVRELGDFYAYISKTVPLCQSYLADTLPKF